MENIQKIRTKEKISRPPLGSGEAAPATEKREEALDFLRFLALLAVMGLHVNSSVWQQIPMFSPQWVLATVLRQTWAVPVLVMITGRLLLDPDRAPDLRKRIFRLVRVYPLWSLLYQLFYLARRWPAADWKGFLAGCVTGAYHMWYLWMLLGLYLMTPVLRAVARDRRLCGYFLGMHLLAGVMTVLVPKLPLVGHTLGAVAAEVHPELFLGYGGLYLLGWYLHRWPPREGLVYGLGLGSWLLALAGNGILAWKTGANTEFFTSYLSSAMLFQAAAVYTLFTRRIRIRFPKALAELSMGAFLCHALVNEGVTALFGQALKDPVWILPATGLVAAGSFGCAYILKKLPLLGKFLT